MMRRLVLLTLGVFLPIGPLPAEEPASIKLLFLGDNGHHRPAERFRQLQPVLAAHGIDVTYTDKIESLNPKTLASYDGLIHLRQHRHASPPSRRKPCSTSSRAARASFRCTALRTASSTPPKYIALVGAQFQRHGTGTFRTTIAEPDHPIMKGFDGFESWDETYVHTKHNDKDRTVLEYREEQGDARSRGPGCGRRARAASSTPPGATTNAPGAIPASRTSSSAASAGPSARTRASCRLTPISPEMTTLRQGRQAVRVHRPAKIPLSTEARGTRASRSRRCRSRSSPEESHEAHGPSRRTSS